MNQVTLNLAALRHNHQFLEELMAAHGASWTVVTKVLCGHRESLQSLHDIGIRSIGESRLTNLRQAAAVMPDTQCWYLRPPHLSRVPQIVALSQTSLNSEMAVIEAISKEAVLQHRQHHIIIMIELGDLREGILPGTLMAFYEHAMRLPNLMVLGLGSNLGCLSGAVPSQDQLMQLVLYKELLELKFGQKIPLISAGSSAVLPLLIEGKVPRAVNHFRVGESLYLGSDLIRGGTLPGMRNDVFRVEAEIAEIQEKSLFSQVETSDLTPFGGIRTSPEGQPGLRGHRALLTIGQLDTDVAGLEPENSDHQIVGASSDITVVNLGDNPEQLKVGDSIRFRVSYSALLRLMNGRYVDKLLIDG
jgi:predicted amino acid racemase